MNKMIFVGATSFVLGAVVGAAGMWKYAQKRANIAIEETRKVYADRKKTVIIKEEVKEEESNVVDKNDIQKLNNVVQNYQAMAKEPEVMKPPVNVTYISNVEYGEEEQYDTKELILDTDTEDVYERMPNGDTSKIDNPDDILGINWMDHFDVYEDDTCYVRNNDTKIDYCINKTMEGIDDDPSESD